MKIFAAILTCLSCLLTTAFADEAAKPAPKMTITSNAYLDKMAIPTLYTCDDKNVSPQLSWSDVPAKTVSLALVMKDIDAPSGTFYHWIFFNIPPSITELPQGSNVPAGAISGKNSFGKTEYDGPCPPKGSAHNYIITLYALDAKLNLPNGADAQNVLDAMKNHIISQVELTGVYSRWIA